MPDIHRSRSREDQATARRIVEALSAGNMLRVLLPAVVVAGLLIAGWLGFQHFRRAAAAATTIRLAVLPFASLSTDPAYGFFADGLQEDLLTALSQQAPGVGVISRTTMMTYRDHPRTINEIAAELHVTHVLESSVRRDAEFVTLNVQLIDAARDQHLWSMRYDRTVAESRNLSSEVVRDIAAQLGTRTVRVPFTAPVTHDQEAYDLYLKAKAEMGVQVFLPGDTEVVGWLDRAIARDPSFMDAYLQRARARLFIHVGGQDRSQALVEAVRADIDMARKLAPDDPRVHWAESFYAIEITHDVQKGLAEIDEAMKSGISDSVWERFRAVALAALGRVQEAADICRRVVDLDPGNPGSLVQCAWSSASGREPREALRYFDMALGRDPDNAAVKYQRAVLVAGYTGNLDALRSLQGDSGMSESTTANIELRLLRLDGHYREFMSRSAELLRQPRAGSDSQVQVRAQRGEVALLLGDRKRAEVEGRAILAAAQAPDPPSWERPFRLADASIGHLLVGQCDLAAKSAREAQDLLPRGRYSTWAAMSGAAAVVAAWCGRKDDAVGLLETLTSEAGGLPPADVALDPVYTVPLGDHKGFLALKARLEQQMRNTKLE